GSCVRIAPRALACRALSVPALCVVPACRAQMAPVDADTLPRIDDRACIYELKPDGFRALAFVERGRCRLVSPNGHRFVKWPRLCDAIANAVRAETAVLDGELVCLADDGRPDFRALLFRGAEPVFYPFDLLMLDG